VRLIQCDLAKHSGWFQKCVSASLGPDATAAKKTLAESILGRFLRLGFDQVCWRGDGGLFAHPEQLCGGVRVVEAARALFEVFLGWQQSADARLSVKDLGLRISCHTCPVWIDKKTDYWSSPGLNDFCKYERYLSHENAISITDEIFKLGLEHLRENFEDRRHEVKIDNTGIKWVVYYDHVTALQDSAKKEAEATAKFFRTRFGAQPSSGVAAETQRFAMGDSIVLGMISSPDETIDIELEEVPSPGFAALEQRFPEWDGYRQKIVDEINKGGHLGSGDWEKGAPLLLRPPLIDFPVGKITYSRIKYSGARSFFTLLDENPALWKQLAEAGADYGREMPKRPGILVAHMVVLALGTDGKPCVVLAQRSTRQESNMTFEGGKWSASIEEQFVPSDQTFEWTITRGLKEELLGPHAEKSRKRVAALFLERRILNLAAAVVCWTGLSLNEIHDAWLDCKDHDEHSQIVGLPIDYSLVKECVDTGRLSEAAQRRCYKIDELTWGRTTNWELHKTSLFRLALAFWAIQNF